MRNNFKKASIFFITLVIIVLFVILLSLSLNNSLESGSRGEINKVSLNASYSVNGGEFRLNEPDNLDAKQQLIVARGHFSQDIEKNQALMFHVNYFNLSLKVNGEEVYSYGDDHPSFVKTGGNAWITYILPTDISSSDNIEIILSAPNNYVKAEEYKDFFNSIYLGSEGSLFTLILHKMTYGFVAGIFFIISGLVLLIVSIIMKKSVGKDYLFIALIMLGFGVWSISDIGFMSIIIPYPAFNDILVYGMVMLTSIFSIEYIRLYLSGHFKKLFGYLSIILSLITILCFILQISGIEDLYYLMGYYQYLIMIVAIALFVSLCIEFTRKGTESINSKIIMISFAFYLVSVMIDGILYFTLGNTDRIYSTTFGIIAFVLGQIIIIIRQEKEKFLRKEQLQIYENELLQSKISLMLSQIQPHFLFNSLTSIRYLLNKNDAKAASKAIEHFAKYLRENTDSISKNCLIPLEQELNHLENYVYLEKLRFGDIINVEYDLKAKDFMLPAITIQPLVENAIKYGITRKDKGGSIMVSTEDKENFYEIKIIDDGVGFDINEYIKDGKSHVGIENVRSRINLMCKGSLDIESTPGKGTTVKIRIPKGKA